MSVKISELPILSSLADNDVIAGVDTSANVTSKIEMATLKNYIDTNTQYTAGTNIDITNNVVSAPNVYNKTETDGLIDDLETNINEQLEEKDEQIEELQSEVDSLSTIFNAFPTESGEGENLTLDDTAEVKFKKFDLKGNTSQTTYNGINLININSTNSVPNNYTITNTNKGHKYLITSAGTWWQVPTYKVEGILPSTQYTYSLDISEISITSGKTSRVLIDQLDSDNQVISVSGTNHFIDASTTGTYNKTLTTTADTVAFMVRIYVEYSASTANTYVTLNNVMIEKGSSVSPYQPYVGGTASPNPSYPQPVNVVSGDNEIQICGKNLLNMNGSVTYQGTSINFVGSEMIFSKTGQDGISAGPRTQLIPYYANQGDVFTFSGTYLSGTINLGGSQDYRVYVYPVDINGNTNDSYKCQINLSKSSTTPSASLSYTLPYDIIGFKAGAYFPSATNTTTGDVKIGLQLEKGSSATTYEPYQGNTYNIDLPVENLFDKSTITSGSYISDTGAVVANNTTFYGDYIKVTPSTTYHISGRNNGWSTIALYNSSKTFISRLNETNNRITTTDQTHYIRVVGALADIDTIQVEKGTKANSYTPYGTTPIELCKIGTYQDYFYKDSDKWYLHKEIKKKVLNGIESWTYTSVTQGSLFRTSNTVTDHLKNDMYSPYSDYYKGIPSGTVSQRQNNQFYIQTNFNYLDVIDNRYTNANDFKSWITNNNVSIYYILATPTNTEITYQPLIDQLNLLEKAISYDSQTNISQVNNDLGFIIYAEAIKSLENVLDRLALVEE